MSTSAGRTCPLRYRYAPEVFAAAATLRAETLYVVGGLYGNIESLRRVFEMKREEERMSGGQVDLLFNGDFNWFACDAEGFGEINAAVLEHAAILGNVEAELDPAGDDNGCGCNYPDYIPAAVVDRSNAIMRRLKATASAFPDVRARIAALPMYCSVEIGALKIGVVHGDAESLAGWGFAYEAMPALPGEAETGYRSAPDVIARIFGRSGVAAFASTHTGLPVLQDFEVSNQRRLVINNGAAGLPSFKGSGYGLLTRISSRPETPRESIYGSAVGGVRFDALAIRYDAAAWLKRFTAHWPPGSAAHEGYHERITQGPDFSIARAVRLARVTAA